MDRNTAQHCPPNFDRAVRVPVDPSVARMVGASAITQTRVPTEHDWRQLFDIVEWGEVDLLGPAGHFCTRCLSEVTPPDESGERKVKYTGQVEQPVEE